MTALNLSPSARNLPVASIKKDAAVIATPCFTKDTFFNKKN